MSTAGGLRAKQEPVVKDVTQPKFEIHDIVNTKSQYSCVGFLSDSSHIVTGAADGSLAAHEPEGKGTAWAQEPMTEKDFVEQVAAHPERPHIFAAAVSDQKDPKESHVRYCDIRVRPSSRSEGKKGPLRTPGDVMALAWHPDGTRLLLSHRSGRVTMHDTRRIGRSTTAGGSSRAPEVLAERNLTWELNAMQFTADGRSILAAYGDAAGGGVRLLADDLREIAEFPAHCAPCISITSATHNSRPLLAVGCNDASVSVWDMRTMAVVRTITEPDLPVRSVKWSNDGSYLAYEATVSGSIDKHQYSAVDIAVLDSQESIFGPLTRRRLEVPMQPGGALVLSGGMAWSPKQQLMAFCGDVRDARGDKGHYSFDPRAHVWLVRAPA